VESRGLKAQALSKPSRRRLRDAADTDTVQQCSIASEYEGLPAAVTRGDSGSFLAEGRGRFIEHSF